jgi:hypothetical protein
MAMKIELTDQQERAVKQGRPVQVVDPATQQAYFLIAREVYERSRSLTDRPEPAPGVKAGGIPPGIRRSQEAYWRDLPELLKLKSRRRRWVAYHGEVRVGFAQTSAELYQQCLRRGLKEEDIYIDRLEPRALPPWEAEEIEAPFDVRESVPGPPVPPAP